MLSLIAACGLLACAGKISDEGTAFKNEIPAKKVLPGAYQTDRYLPMLRDKRVATVVNHTSMIGRTHLVDSLITLGVNLQLIFAPEHGFKGTAYNGEEIKDGVYKENIPIRSLYGKTRKPSALDMEAIDVIVFDIQDVGARFYTFSSTLHHVMDAAAQYEKEVIILDRPNPNGHYVDGPVLEEQLTSFVGMHPVPVVYGMTIGEYGQMINGEGWLTDQRSCALEVIPNANYSHDTPYDLPIPPSPNLPNQRSILLYPSLCFFEGTVMNEGRGTDRQFQVFGHPDWPDKSFQYTPESMSSSRYPKHEGKRCGGVDLTSLNPGEIYGWKRLNLAFVMSAYAQLKGKISTPFFTENGWFDKLAGTKQLREMIIAGKSEEEIRASWQEGLNNFKEIRQNYLIYP